MEHHPDGSAPVLPTLEDRCYLLEADGRATGPLQSLVLDHLLSNDGDAYWVDAAGHARADAFARIAPSDRLLDRVRVARGFTAHQHAALLDRVTDRVDGGTAMVVAPAVDATYRDEFRSPDAEAMIRASVEHLDAVRREHELPIVVTCRRRDDLTALVADRIEETIRCEETRFGPRFVGEEFETLVYPAGSGYVQTTLTFWQRVLGRRASIRSADRTETAEVVTRGAN